MELAALDEVIAIYGRLAAGAAGILLGAVASEKHASWAANQVHCLTTL